MKEKRVVIFCSSSYDIDPACNEIAREVVRELCRRGYTIVSGGAVKGTMGVVSEEAERCGGRHIGVLPRFMAEFRYPGLSELVWTDTMAQRKERMREGTVAAIALPGGIGTLDELIETHVLAKLGKYGGKVLALNTGGFYEPLKDLLDHYVATRNLSSSDRELAAFPETVGQLMEMLEDE